MSDTRRELLSTPGDLKGILSQGPILNRVGRSGVVGNLIGESILRIPCDMLKKTLLPIDTTGGDSFVGKMPRFLPVGTPFHRERSLRRIR